MEEKVIHKTRVRIDLIGLKETIEQLNQNYLEIGSKETTEGRSRFSQWNNINHFYKRILSGEHPSEVDPSSGYAIIDMIGSCKGSTARIYYKPSVTSLSKHVRKHIVPITDGNVFVYFDLKAAEFFMNCVFCGEHEAIKYYQEGNDLYGFYKHLFPENLPRKVYKEALIANMFGMTGYTLAIRCREAGIDISQTQAERMLQIVDKNLKSMKDNKQRVIGNALRTKKYQCPKGFDTSNLQTISVPTPKNPNINALLALSTYVQSALGLWMQDLTAMLDPKIQGTLISVFDSVTAEVKKESVEKYKAYIERAIYPFKVGGYHVGSTFYEAQEGDKS